MARYEPVPYVRPERPRTLRLADLYLRSGDAIADAERRRGDIQAQLWGNIGQAVGQTASAIIQAPQMERERLAKEAEQAQASKLKALQIGEAEREINERENFDLAMGAGSRQKTLKALEARPELYAKAQQHFAAIDTSMKQLMGNVAAGVADFGYTPEAAIAGLDDLIDQGFDERKLEQYRAAIVNNPASVKQIVQSLLKQSPDPRHHEMAKPDPLTEVSPGATLYNPKTDEDVFTAPNRTPVAKALQAKDVLLDGRPAVVNFDPASGRFSANGEDVTARVKPIPPQGPAGGEPLESVIDPQTGEPKLVPRSQARGMRPATSREQPTEDERKSAGWLEQMTGAIATMDALEDQLTQQELYQIQTLPQEGLIGMVNRGELSENAKRYFQAFEEFTEARLRSVSGATITPQEEARDRRIYAKQFGETPELAKQRRGSRGRAQEALKARAGRALPKPKTDSDVQEGDIEYDMNGKPIPKKDKP